MENKFEYTYSAPRNAEIEKIRKKYVPQTSTESKLEQIKKLDSSVESEAVGCALGIGIPGSLVLGIGMCCTMVWTDLFVLGIIIGIIGMLYGVNTLNSSDLTLLTEVTAEITSDKYRRWNDSYSLYLCAEANDDGLRTNLLLSTITDGGIVADSLEIKAESTVEGDWNKYLSSPAEADIQLIKGSEENGCLLLPVIYFDGISEIEKVLILTVDQNGKLSRTGEIVQYDLRSDTLLAEVSGKYCYCIFGDAIFSADSEKASVISQLELE